MHPMSPRAPNIADKIFDDLKHQILAGALPAGSRLPGERDLAKRYNTNRNTLREAVRMLEQSDLVTVRHGQGVTIADFRHTGTLDLLAPFLQAAPDPTEVANIVKDVLAPRTLFLEYATALAARRATDADIQKIRDLTELLIAAFEAGDPQVVAHGFQRWLDALVDAGHSVAIRWIANPFFKATREIFDRFPMLWVLEETYPDHLRELVDALEAGDEKRASLATRTYYDRVDDKIRELLGAAESGLLEELAGMAALGGAPPERPNAVDAPRTPPTHKA